MNRIDWTVTTNSLLVCFQAGFDTIDNKENVDEGGWNDDVQDDNLDADADLLEPDHYNSGNEIFDHNNQSDIDGDYDR